MGKKPSPVRSYLVVSWCVTGRAGTSAQWKFCSFLTKGAAQQRLLQDIGKLKPVWLSAKSVLPRGELSRDPMFLQRVGRTKNRGVKSTDFSARSVTTKLIFCAAKTGVSAAPIFEL